MPYGRCRIALLLMTVKSGDYRHKAHPTRSCNSFIRRHPLHGCRPTNTAYGLTPPRVITPYGRPSSRPKNRTPSSASSTACCSSMKRNAEAGRASVSPTRAAAKTKSPRCARAFCLQPFHGESCVTRIRCAKAHPNVRVMALKQETRAVRGLLASFGGTRFAGAALLIAPYGRHCAARPFTCIWLL